MLSSCSVYRSGQTPDDLYYTPTREVATASSAATAAGNDGYVQGNSSRDDGRRYNNESDDYSGYDDLASADDRWLMMRVRNRARWSYFDNYAGFYSPYSSFYSPFYSGFGYQPGFSLGMTFGNPYAWNYYNPYSYGYYNHFNNYWNWNYNYNPYYGNIIVVNPKVNPAGYTRARSFDMNTYRNTNVNRGRSTYINGRERYNTNPNNLNGRRDTYNNRRVFSNSSVNDRNNNSYTPQDRPVRTYTPSNNRSYSPSPAPSSGGGGGGSRPSGGGGGGRPGR